MMVLARSLLLSEYMFRIKVSVWVRWFLIGHQIMGPCHLLQQFYFCLFWEILVVDAIKQILVGVLVPGVPTRNLEWIWCIQLGVSSFQEALSIQVSILRLQTVKYVLGHSLFVQFVTVFRIKAEV